MEHHPKWSFIRGWNEHACRCDACILAFRWNPNLLAAGAAGQVVSVQPQYNPPTVPWGISYTSHEAQLPGN